MEAPWQKSDLIALDNMLAARSPASAKIMVGMGKMVHAEDDAAVA